MSQNQTAQSLLEELNTTHRTLHARYEEYFWISYMGDHSVDVLKNEALAALDAFKARTDWYDRVCRALATARPKDKGRLLYWKKFFELYQVPASVIPLKKKIDALETRMHKKVAKRKEGYHDPTTQTFVKASALKMRSLMRTHKDEAVRKACFDALESLALTNLDDYVVYVQLLNQYARALGYEDFYAFKIMQEEGMTKQELFAIFDTLYAKTKYAFLDIREMAKRQKGLRKPWNFGFMMSGDFTKEEDQYFPFSEAVPRWGRSFAALGIDFAGGSLQLDLLQRDGKYSNGFCHWPQLVHYVGNTRVPGSANFTCNVVLGQPGSSFEGYHTLFHEGGHAAHFLNTTQTETCLNHEYPPMSTAWAETQSMFLDSILASYEWKSRYAYNRNGEVYPFALQKKKIERLHHLNPLWLMGVLFVSDFERAVYEHPNLTTDVVVSLAKKMYKKYFDRSVDSLSVLSTPHLYSWSSTCSYHGYGLAELAVQQWRAYFYKKYGYIVDNPQIGKEMKAVWKLGASKTFKECVIRATGKPLSPNAWLKESTRPLASLLRESKARAARLESVPVYSKKVDIRGHIAMVSGKETIADTTRGFQAMTDTYAQWLDGKHG